jgi:DNA-binding MurR/RpiR family transcriptional regulator
MDTFDLMETKRQSFTKTDRKIYENLTRHPVRFAEASYEELVNIMGVSQSALTRFAKKLGFSGYADLQYQLRSDIKSRDGQTEEETNAQVFGSFLKCVEDEVDHEELSRLAQRVLAADRVTCLGFQYSGLPARFLSFNLMTGFGINADKPEFDYLIHSYTSSDLIIVFSAASGEFFRPLLKRVSGFDEGSRPHVTLVTMSPKHTLRRFCDQIVLLPSSGKLVAPHVVTLENMMFMMFADMLLAELIRIRKEQ